MNISQQEYATKYREYLRRVHERQKREATDLKHAILHEWDENYPEETEASMHMLSIVPHSIIQANRRQSSISRMKRALPDMEDDVVVNGNDDDDEITFRIHSQRKRASSSVAKRKRAARNEKTNILLHFPLHINAATSRIESSDVEEANIRLMLIHKTELALAQRIKQRNAKNHHANAGNNNNNNNNKAESIKCEHEKAEKHKTAGSVANEMPKIQKHVLNLKVYQRLRHGKRQWLDGQKIELEMDLSRPDDTHSQWLQFDVTKAVESWLTDARSNLGLEVQCDNCQRLGARLLNEGTTIPINNSNSADSIEEAQEDEESASNQLMPVLNIIARLSGQHHKVRNHKHSPNSLHHSNQQQQQHHHINTAHKKRERHKTDCHKNNQKCCRHQMEVVFKEVKGFDFIISPKSFDAGYCHGHCPPNYNIAHNHAMLQSLIWKKDHSKVPKPCCAPSKLTEVEVLHLDETDSTSLKISTWKKMKVLECACS